MDASDASPPRRSPRGADPLDRRLDRWVSTGRQFVDGVVGARPGSRPAPRAAERRAAGLAGLESLGRWVDDRLDWFLEDGDDWREPWQDAPPRRRRGISPEQPERPPASMAASQASGPPPARPRRGLEAVSRRGPASLPPRTDAAPPATAPPPAPAPGADEADWPDEASFRLNRWQRPPLSPSSQAPGAAAAEPNPAASARSAGRPLPRSSRRR